MSRLPKDADVDLRRVFPDAALGMDTELLLHQARELGINPHFNKRSKLPVLRIPLTFDHEISISPVDKGAKGVAEWFTFSRPCDCPIDHPEVTSRVYVNIEDKLFQGVQPESFTIEAPNLEMMLRISLSVYYTMTGKKLQPICGINVQ